MGTVTEPRVERKIEVLRKSYAVSGDIGDRVLTRYGIEMIVNKSSLALTTVFKVTGQHPNESSILLVQRKFLQPCCNYTLDKNPKYFALIGTYYRPNGSWSHYTEYDHKLKTPWRISD